MRPLRQPLKKMTPNRGPDINLLSSQECSTLKKGKMKLEAVQEIAKRRDGRVPSLKGLCRRSLKERS